MRKGLLTTGLLVAAAALPAGAESPLPAFASRVQPAVHFLIDSSGSMLACDGGTVDPAADLTSTAGGGFLFDPRRDDRDDGDCANRPATGAFPISRLEAVKLSISRILDADGNGTIDEADEQGLRLKIGMSQFAATDPYRTNLDSLRPIGSSFADVWTAVRGIQGAGNTPSGPALAGARALSIANCYDGDPATSCALGPRQNDASGDDVAKACRDYYVVFLTDGEPNQDSSTIAFDPIPISRRLAEKRRAADAESLPPIAVRTIAIGFGAQMSEPGTVPRGVINCMGYWGSAGGSRVADADKDGDGDAAKMDDDADGATPGRAATCTAMASLQNEEKYYGNGFFASDSRSLSNAFKRILNAIQAGTYSRASPVVDTASTTSSQFVYGSYFEVPADALDWRGHLKKFRVRSGDAGLEYVDCDDPAGPASLDPEACWDAGDKLRLRDWRTRRLLAVDFSEYPARLEWDSDLQTRTRVGWRGDDASRPVTVRNVVPELAAAVASNPPAVTSGTRLHDLAAVSTLRDERRTYRPGDAVPAAALRSAAETLAFAAGRPGATFADGSTRCGQAVCTETDPSPKLGDSFNSRPVLVGTPLGVVADPDYNGEFRNRELSPRSGADAPLVGGSIASPCPAGVTPCTVARRRAVVYLAANDGTVHAFDDATGEELWAFLPPGHLSRLALAREGRAAFVDGLPVVRDVKFPCERESTGACLDGAQNLPFEDGKWHTVLFLGQGAGGAFHFALDVTNPVAPEFLWEYRDPQRLGLAIAPAAVAEIPTDGMLTTAATPGSVVFLTGGMPTNPGADLHVQTIRAFDGALLATRAIAPPDLAGPQTRPEGIANALTGTPHPVDGNLDGDIDRVYFGDREGRMWKACRLRASGAFDVDLFFDPAIYDTGTTSVGQPTTPGNPTAGLADAAARMRLRGPLFFPPDVTRTPQGELVVAFGSGNLQDPLSPPETYKNFVWGIADDASVANDGCGVARRNVLAEAAPGVVSFLEDGGTATFERVHPLEELLSGAPLIFDQKLFYPEYDPDPDGDVCTDDFASRVVAVSVFSGGIPADGPFEDENGDPTNVLEYPGKLVTGLDIDPRTGTLLVQTSRGGKPPDAVALPDLSQAMAFVGWRQLE